MPTDSSEREPPPWEQPTLPPLAKSEVPARPDRAADAGVGQAVEQPFGEYGLLVELGRGGMGVVFKARHHRLKRTVALKRMLPGALPGPEEMRRFHAEVEAAAGLQHPNIVRVHEVGEAD